MGQQLKCRPSEVYFIKDEIAAWCFDRAVTLFGTTVERAINKATKDAKPEHIEGITKQVIEKWITTKEQKATASGFRDPAKAMSF